ncbi:MAG: outer membrane lipoprotein carrier protein LolA [Bacteroidetes bacterium]|nr:outer membrane lipoprotein carrier protein LolA [Bacteroidota bacterium]
MKMIKLFFTAVFLFVFIILSVVEGFAQMPKEVVDAKAKAILDEVAKQTKTYSTIKADFTAVTEKKETNTKSSVTDTQTGTLQLKGTKYKLEFKGQTIFCDGKTQWTYIKESNEVQINNAPDPNATDNINPVNIFTLYEKGYKYKYEKEDVLNGAKVDAINLYPLDPDKKSFHTIQLFIDKAKKQITSAKIMNKNGTSNTITVKNFTTNSEMADAMFTFNKADYKGVEVVDLRDN